MHKRVYISGGSGAGVSTLGAALAGKLNLPHIDVDDHYWYPTTPPFQLAREPEERLRLLRLALADGPWVLSGSLESWGAEIIQQADLVVFVDTPTAVRIKRLQARESLRFGQRLLPGGDMHVTHQKFLAWAESYEAGTQSGRSRLRHERWLKQLSRPLVRLDGTKPVEDLATSVLAHLQT